MIKYCENGKIIQGTPEEIAVYGKIKSKKYRVGWL